jgi:hypothetical protein
VQAISLRDLNAFNCRLDICHGNYLGRVQKNFVQRSTILAKDLSKVCKNLRSFGHISSENPG